MNREFGEKRQKSTTGRSRARNKKSTLFVNNQNETTPFEEKRNNKKKGKIWVKFLVFAVAEVFALFMIFGYAYAIKQYNKIQRPEFDEENVKNVDLSIDKIKQMEGYWNIAVFGVDSRDNSVGKGSNSDVIIVVSINQGTGEIKMSSVYRDTYLDTGYGKFNKINNAYAVGGPEQALKAINKNLDLNITDYVTFNWKAVATAINILGGVDVHVDEGEFKYINSYITETVKGTGIGSVHLKQPGMNHLDGIQAVAYARLRYMDSDFERTERQREIIQLAFDKAKKADLKTKNDLLGNMLAMVATNMTWEDGLSFIERAEIYHIGDKTGFPFTKDGSNIRGKGICVIPQNLVSNVIELHKFFFGDEIYEVSNTVQDINYRISLDSGRGYSGSGNSNSGGSTKKTTEATKTTETTKHTTEVAESSTNTSGRPYETNRNGDIIWLDEDEEETVSVETNQPSGSSRSSSSSESGRVGASDTTKTSTSTTGAVTSAMQGTTAQSIAPSTNSTVETIPAIPSTTPAIIPDPAPAPDNTQEPIEGENGGPGVS